MISLSTLFVNELWFDNRFFLLNEHITTWWRPAKDTSVNRKVDWEQYIYIWSHYVDVATFRLSHDHQLVQNPCCPCSAEQVMSHIQIVNNELRSTMADDWFALLAVLACECNATL